MTETEFHQDWTVFWSEIGNFIGILAIAMFIAAVIIRLLGDNFVSEFFICGAVVFGFLYFIPHLYGVW